MRAIVSTHRPELDRILVDLAAAATGQQLQRTCGHFTTSDAEPLVDTWAARDVGMCELKAGMSELRVVLPTADAIAAHDRIDRRAQQLWREQHAAAQAAAAAAAASDEPDGCGDAAASPDAAASLSPDPVGCLRADAFLEAVDALDAGLPADASGRDRHLVELHTTVSALEEPPAAHDADGEVGDVRDERRAPTMKQRRLLWLRDSGLPVPVLRPHPRAPRALHRALERRRPDRPLQPRAALRNPPTVRLRPRLVHRHRRPRPVTFTPPDGDPVPVAEPLPGVTVPEAIFPEWPDEIPDDVDPWEVWPRSPLTPTGAVASPDYNACLEVLWDELHRHQPPRAPDDIIVIAAWTDAAASPHHVRTGVRPLRHTFRDPRVQLQRAARCPMQRHLLSCDSTRRRTMPDLLIRDVPDDVVAALDARAKRLGVSRTEYLRREMVRAASTSDEPVTVESLRRFSETFADLGDPEVMRGAWE